jgi:hypothetical protein
LPRGEAEIAAGEGHQDRKAASIRRSFPMPSVRPRLGYQP